MLTHRTEIGGGDRRNPAYEYLSRVMRVSDCESVSEIRRTIPRLAQPAALVGCMPTGCCGNLRSMPVFRVPFGAALVVVLGLAGAGACGDSKGAHTGSGGTGAASAGTGGAGGQGAASGSSGAQAGSTGAAGTVAGPGGKGGNTASAGSGGSAGSSGLGPGGGNAGAAGRGAAGAAAGTSGGGGGTSGGSNEPRSCSASGPGLTTCGKSGNESCCTSPLVAGGPFFRTYMNTGSAPTGTADQATVSSFRLDKYEITVGRFRQYVKDLSNGGSPPAAGSGKHTHLNGGKGLSNSGSSGGFEPGWDTAWNTKIPSGAGAAAQWNTQLKCNKYGTWTDEPGENELLPLTCLNWWESHAFCIWDGGFLPSEAEWRYAAAGGDEHRMYPWGSMNPGTQNQYAIYDCCYPDGQCKASGGPECSGFINAAPVGFAALGAGRYGQLDLVGSVFEWLVDGYANYVSPCVDCAYFSGSSSNRVLPGGGFRTTLMPYLQSSNRSAVSYAETFRGDFAVGARCGRTP